jgi:hypothetical protein
MVSKATVVVLMSAICGSLALVNPAAATQAGCVDLLTDCNPDAALLETVCGPGVHHLVPPVSSNISFVVFGPTVVRAILTECGTGATTVLTNSDLLCGIDDFNDNTCAIEIATAGSPAPSLGRAGLGFVIFALLSIGVIGVRRRPTMS